MMREFFHKPLIVFELANNHMGNVDHGLRVIREIAEASRGCDFNFGFKFQYRELETFIHPDFRNRQDIKYVKRFIETRLTESGFLTLKRAIDDLGFISVCTPFDETSVDIVERHGFDILKIASCSFTDWPLLERIVKTERPIIASTAGASVEELDRVVSFLEHRSRNFSLMHCVAEYPAQSDHLQLNQIDFLKGRYPGVRIGYSAHEAPDNLSVAALAAAKGAAIFEKHVGVKTDRYPVNDYSATPDQIPKWLAAIRDALAACGTRGERPPARETELATLRSLRRGVFAKTGVAKGELIDSSNVLLAIPTVDGQITANDLSKYVNFAAREDIPAGRPVLEAKVQRIDERNKVYAVMKQVNDLFKTAGIGVPGKADFEISHHYGLEKFQHFGCTIITVINREYCKKLIILLPGQTHPEQYHKQKEETFHILHGKIRLRLDGVENDCKAGDVVTVEKGVKHWFMSEEGAIIEEISSTHYRDDSFYTDPEISRNKNRKTYLTYWIG